MDDVRAVMDAAGSKRAAVIGYSEGGPMSILFAATYPERITALVLAATFAKALQAADYPGGLPPSASEDLARVATPSQGRYLAEHIPGARYLEQEGDSHILWLGDLDGLLSEVEEFLTGARSASDIDRVMTTVLFTDIVGSTRQATELGDRRWHQRLDDYDALVRRQLERFRGRHVKSTGDGTLATFDGPARAVRCASAIREAVQSLDLEVRAGVHTGEVELRGDDVVGLAVHIASRVAARAGPAELLVSRTVTDLVVGSGLEFEDRGEFELKGVPGTWRLYSVKG